MFYGSGLPSIGVEALPPNAFVLDVREDDEWAAGHAPGAHHVPMMQIPARASEVPTDRPVVVACRVGQRSAQVVAYLRANGWDQVVNLDGGMEDWVAAGLPVVSEDGGAGQIV